MIVKEWLCFARSFDKFDTYYVEVHRKEWKTETNKKKNQPICLRFLSLKHWKWRRNTEMNSFKINIHIPKHRVHAGEKPLKAVFEVTFPCHGCSWSFIFIGIEFNSLYFLHFCRIQSEYSKQTSGSTINKRATSAEKRRTENSGKIWAHARTH